MKKESLYVQQCWRKCLEKMHELIPAHKIKVYDDTDTIYKIVELHTLNHFHKVFIHCDTDNSSADSLSTTNDDNNINNITSESTNSDISFNISEIPVEIADKRTDDSMNNSLNQSTQQMKIMVSTPISKNKKSKNADNLISDDKNSNEPVIVSLKPKQREVVINKTELSKSSNMLIKIFGEDTLIYEYDIDKSVKKHPHDPKSKKRYQHITAKIEIKLNIKDRELKKDLKELETSTMMESSSITTLPTSNEKETYNELILKLQYISVLQKQLSRE